MREFSRERPNRNGHLLTHVLDSFNTTIAGLDSSYRELKERIRQLNVQLSEKNKQLEENLYEVNRLRRFLDAILNSMSDGVIVVDTDGKIVLFNGGAENLTGYSGREVLGEPYSHVFGKRVSERFSPLYTLVEGVPLLSEEKEIQTKGGNHVPVRYSTSLVTDSHDRVLGAVEVLSDLTRIKRLERTMQQVKTQAALNKMAGLVAHEVRNPLGGVRGYVDLIAESMEEDDPRRKMLDDVIESVKRLDEIVLSFQLYARPVTPHFEEMDVCGFVGDVLTFFDQDAGLEEKGIRLVVTLSSEAKGMKVRSDPVLLEQAILVVLDNGVKAMEAGGTLRVEVREERSVNDRMKDRLAIVVSDTGVGMGEEILTKLFTPFFTTRERGMGLGLAVAQNFVRLQHGDIFVESEEGKGSTVTIVLPKD